MISSLVLVTETFILSTSLSTYPHSNYTHPLQLHQYSTLSPSPNSFSLTNSSLPLSPPYLIFGRSPGRPTPSMHPDGSILQSLGVFVRIKVGVWSEDDRGVRVRLSVAADQKNTVDVIHLIF